MTPQQIEKKRKYFFMGISLLATAITLASASATYAINQKSFADWKNWGDVLALFATAGVEATFALTLYGVTYALTGPTEKRIGIALLLGTVAVMAANYVTHHMVTTRARLSDWQIDYIQWIGPLSLFGILLLIVGIIVFNHDAKKRTQERDFTYAAERKAFEWRQQQLESPEFNEYMEKHKPQVFEEARRLLKLPTPIGQNRAIGFVKDEDDPKGSLDQD